MEILDYKEEMAGELAAFYNGMVQGVPYCFPIQPREWIQGIGLESDIFSAQAIKVAFEQGRVVGFAHPAALKDIREGGAEGQIRALFFPHDRRDIGFKLVETAEEFFISNKVVKTSCFPLKSTYRFYHFGYGYLSEHLAHIYGVLGLAGYKTTKGEIYLDWEDFTPPEVPDAGSVTFSIEHRPGRGKLPGLGVRVFENGAQIGICESVSAAEFTREPGMETWAFIQWIGIEEDNRGQGTGRSLLLNALAELHRLGFRNLSISTSWMNYRALLFYSSTGFKTRVTTFLLEKNLHHDPDAGQQSSYSRNIPDWKIPVRVFLEG